MVNSIEERGRLKGLREAVRKLLEKQFGRLDADVIQQLEGMSFERLEEMLLASADAHSLAELGLGAA